MKSMVKNGELQFNKHLLNERRMIDLGAKWFLIEEETHAYILIRNTFFSHFVSKEIEPEGKVVADGNAEFTQNGSWVVPRMIADYFQSSGMVIEEDSKGFFVTSQLEEKQYEKEITDLSDQILSQLEDSD